MDSKQICNKTTQQNINKCFICGVEGTQNPSSPFTLAEQFIICWYEFENEKICSDMCFEIAKSKSKKK